MCGAGGCLGYSHCFKREAKTVEVSGPKMDGKLSLMNGNTSLLTQYPQETKQIVYVSYIFDTYQACLEHAVSPKTSTPKLPLRKNYLHVLSKEQSPIKISCRLDPGDPSISQPSTKRRKVNDGYVAAYRDDMTLLKENVSLEGIPASCAQRPCPLVCINQDIVCPGQGQPRITLTLTDFRWTLSSQSLKSESLKRHSRKTRMF